MGRKMKIVRINGFRIPGLEYPSKPLEDLLELKDDDTELVVRDAPDAFVHFVEQNYENELVAVLHAREAWTPATVSAGKADEGGDPVRGMPLRSPLPGGRRPVLDRGADPG